VTVFAGLGWTVLGLLVLVAVMFGAKATVTVAGAIMRVVGMLLGAAYGVLSHDA
jgi:hypothetical protein